MTVINPFDFFVEQYAEQFPFDVCAGAREGADPVPRDRAARAAARARGSSASAPTITPRREHGRLAGAAQPAAAARDQLPRADGARRADAGGDARARERLVPRHRLAAGADPAAPRPRRALRLGLPDPARRRREAARRPGRARRATSPTCTRGPRSTCPARAGSASIRRRACSPARATFRSRARPIPGNAAPVIGFTDVCNVEFAFAMSVTRVHEDPRVTKPYTDAQWEAIDALGERGRPRARAHDVRLTQGGEPTFVSVDDMEGPEWNYTALSPKKARARRGARCAGCARASRPAASCTYGQGKWYPGEPLPRWALGVFWRTRRRAAVARPAADRRHRRSRQRPTLAARERVRRGARAAARVSPRLRDHRVRGRAEAARDRSALPVNVDPLAAPTSRSPTSARGSRACCSAGLDRPAGFVLPLRAAPTARTDRRPDRGEASPLAAAARTPLPAARRFAARPAPAARLAAGRAAGGRRSRSFRVDPFAPRAATCRRRARSRRDGEAARPKAAAAGAARDVIKTALCVEVRDGHLHVFMPPLERLEDYVDAARRDRGDGRGARRSRSRSKATRRRAIRACACSTSRPIPA